MDRSIDISAMFDVIYNRVIIQTTQKIAALWTLALSITFWLFAFRCSCKLLLPEFAIHFWSVYSVQSTVGSSALKMSQLTRIALNRSLVASRPMTNLWAQQVTSAKMCQFRFLPKYSNWKFDIFRHFSNLGNSSFLGNQSIDHHRSEEGHRLCCQVHRCWSRHRRRCWIRSWNWISIWFPHHRLCP